MANPYFRFKQFSVRQESAAMKVGTDGVLLGAWARVNEEQSKILDVGTGTGVIALMMAQRSSEYGTEIVAVEIDKDSAAQAEHNFSVSPWSDRLNIKNISLQDFSKYIRTEDKYDHIISNPPYFVNSLLPPDGGRAQARHTFLLTFEELISCSVLLLNPDGLLSMIIPADKEVVVTDLALERGLYISRKTQVHSLPDTLPMRVLMEFTREKRVAKEDTLIIEAGSPRGYTEKYRNLTKDFYLKF